MAENWRFDIEAFAKAFMVALKTYVNDDEKLVDEPMRAAAIGKAHEVAAKLRRLKAQKGEKRPAGVIGAAIRVARIAGVKDEDTSVDDGK